MDVHVAASKRGPLNELSGPPKVQISELDRIVKAVQDSQKELGQKLGKQITDLKTDLTSRLDSVANQVAATNQEVQTVKTVQARHTEQLGSLAGALQQQQLEINSSKRMLFYSGARKDVLQLGPIKLDNKDPKTVVISTLTDAICSNSADANRQDTERILLQNTSEFYVMKSSKPGHSTVKFRVADPKISNGIWAAKQKLSAGVFLDPMLTPLERSNKKALAQNAEFQAIRKFATDQGKKGHWQLDEYVLKWEAGGTRVQAFFHKAYPLGMLADGKPAPAYPGLAAAVAAGAV
jgi:hypothetical protein